MKLRFLCASAGLAAAFLYFSDSVTVPARAWRQLEPQLEQVTYRGGLVTPPLPKPNVVLTDTAGARFDLRSKTQGHVTLLFFGYTHCPDICPVHMAYLASALKKLPASSAEQFRVVFVTTDPTRDTPKALRAWLDHFDKHFIGLTGSERVLQRSRRLWTRGFRYRIHERQSGPRDLPLGDNARRLGTRSASAS
jgi:cytochrome oxidase Cu insertion factor (SCO1/SenC/PrrC family)